MVQKRSQITSLQNQISKIVDTEKLSPEIVSTGLAEFFIHYCIMKRGVDFTVKMLELMRHNLNDIKEAAALFTNENVQSDQ